MTALRRLFYRYSVAQHSRLYVDLGDVNNFEQDLLLTHF